MSGAFSIGIGMAMGLTLGQYMVRALMPRKIEYVIVCQNCVQKNPAKNKFCFKCGHRLYPQKIACQKCGEKVPDMKFCGNCSSPLNKLHQTQCKIVD